MPYEALANRMSPQSAPVVGGVKSNRQGYKGLLPLSRFDRATLSLRTRRQRLLQEQADSEYRDAGRAARLLRRECIVKVYPRE